MDSTTSAAAAPTAGSEPKKQPKARKAAKDLTLDERPKESEKHAGRREAIKNRLNVARLEEERQLETERPRKPWPTARSWQARPMCVSS
jgi:hypothetical protein